MGERTGHGLRHGDAAQPGQALDIGIYRLDDVVVSARGELFKDSTILPQSYPPGYAIERRDAKRLAAAAKRAAAGARRIDGEWLFVTDHWSDNYYHWLCEALPRLEVLADTHSGGSLLIPAHVLAMPFVRQSLAAWPQFKPEPFEGNLLAERLIVPGHVAPGGYQHPELTKRVASRLERFFGFDEPGGGDRRIYVSRREALKRRLANEPVIAPALARHGFEIVTFDTMDLREQIALMLQTAVLAGPHGAGFANMVFMPRGGQVIELRQAEGPPDTFANLASVCGHAHSNMFCESAEPGMHVHAADLVVDPDELDALLASLDPSK